MRELRGAPILPRGRIAKWSKEQLDKLSTPEVRALMANAERLNETEVAALCNDILTARPRGHAPARRHRDAPAAASLVSRGKAFRMNGVSLHNRTWSRGGIRPDGAVLFAVRAEDVQYAEGKSSCVLWAPGTTDADSPAANERLEHCRKALERGAAEGLMTYGKRAAGVAADANKTDKTDRMDAVTLLKMSIEMRGEEYWATWAPEKRVVVSTYE
jgi:hypothetical protein